MILIQQLCQLDPDFNLSDGELVSIIKTEEDFSSLSVNRNTMKPSVMTMFVFVQRINSNNTIYDDFKIKVITVWKQTPFFRMQDVIGMFRH